MQHNGKKQGEVKMYRQGDVLLIPVSRIPDGCHKEEVDGFRVVLAFGEVTGHAHAIDAALAETFKVANERYLIAKDGAVLRHEEHSPITLPPGAYKVQLQREYEHQGWRRVID